MHLAPAVATAQEPGQQRFAGTPRSHCFIGIGFRDVVVHEAPMLREGLPVNIPVMLVGKKDPAVLRALPWPDALDDFALDHHQFGVALPPDRGSSVAGMMQHGTNKRLRRHVPHQPGLVLLAFVHGQCQTPALAPEPGLADTARVTKEPKHLVDGLWHTLIGVFDDLPTGIAHLTSRAQSDQCASTGFRLRPLLQALMQHFALRHTPRRLDPQHSLVIERPDIVDGVRIRDQGVEQRTQLE